MNAPTIPPEAPAMRMPRVRFSVRGLIIVVAIVAAVLGGLANRSWRMRRLAAYHKGEAAQHSLIAPIGFGGNMVEVHDDDGMRHLEKVRKYERLARYPWLPEASEPARPPRARGLGGPPLAP